MGSGEWGWRGAVTGLLADGAVRGASRRPCRISGRRLLLHQRFHTIQTSVQMQRADTCVRKADNCVYASARAATRCLKKVVFVVDEFQQYAKKGKQQMLYYLLDMLQV